MIIHDRKIYFYCVLTIVYFIITAQYLLFVAPDVDTWLAAWFYDKFFIFQLSSVYLLGCSIIDKYYSPFVHIRFRTRRKAIFSQHMEEYTLAFVLLNFMFVIIIISTLIKYKGFRQGEMAIIIDFYLRYLVGLILISNISLCISKSTIKLFRTFSPGLAIFLLVLDLLVLAHLVKIISPVDFNTIFSWIFYRDSAKSLMALSLYNILLWLYQYKIGVKRDLYL